MKKGNPFNLNLAKLQEFKTNVLEESPDCKEDVLGLVLAMASAYNDLKDSLTIFDFINKNRAENPNEISPERGTLAGMQNNCLKNSLSICWEILVLLDKKKEILESAPIRKALKSLPVQALKNWYELIEAASNKTVYASEHGKELRVILNIRDTLGFHYYGTEKFYEGFKLFKIQNRDAKLFCSFGSDMEGSRFYFADAAVQKKIEAYYNSHSTNEENVLKFARMINHSIRLLIESFLKDQDIALNANREIRRKLKNRK